LPILLKASKSAGAKGDVAKIYRFMHPLHPRRNKTFAGHRFLKLSIFYKSPAKI
jgi:hypothetical protein